MGGIKKVETADATRPLETVAVRPSCGRSEGPIGRLNQPGYWSPTNIARNTRLTKVPAGVTILFLIFNTSRSTIIKQLIYCK